MARSLEICHVQE